MEFLLGTWFGPFLLVFIPLVATGIAVQVWYERKKK